MGLISIFTNTGDRPEAFALLQEYALKQTYKGKVQWVISCDTENLSAADIKHPRNWTVETIDLTHATPEEVQSGYAKEGEGTRWVPGVNSQPRSINACLPRLKGERIFVWEDDEWYGPTYLDYYQAVFTMFPVEVIGQGYAVSYNVQTRSWTMFNNTAHASLSQTAFYAKHLPLFKECVNAGLLYIDLEFWQQVQAAKIPNQVFQAKKQIFVGIKGMPGRGNIGAGRHPERYNFKADPDQKALIEMVGPEVAAIYAPFYQPTKETVAA